MKDSIVIFRSQLLPFSETFIQSQSLSLRNYNPIYVGTHAIDGICLPKDKILVMKNNNLLDWPKTLSYRLTGYSKSIFTRVSFYKPKIIHAHFGPDAVRALPLKSYLNIPLVVTPHGYEITIKLYHAYLHSYSLWLYCTFLSALHRKASMFIAVSEYAKKRMILQNYPQDKICVHYIGIDTYRFTSLLKIRKNMVLFVGRLVEKKGCIHLLKAMKFVQMQHPDVELIIIGDGPLRRELEIYAKKHIKSFQFLGSQSQEVVKKWMDLAKVFCVPSLTATNGNTETFGLVFAEAQCMGLPVVSTMSGGISEAVDHGNSGFLVPEDKVDEIAKYISLLLTDNSLWHKFSLAGQERVRRLFDLKLQTKLLEDKYSELIHAQNR